MRTPPHACIFWLQAISTDARLLTTDFRATSSVAYIVPRDVIRLRTADARLLSLAERLWERAAAGTPTERRMPTALTFSIDVVRQARPRPHGTPTERWRLGATRLALSLGQALRARIDLTAGRLNARVSAGLLASDPSLVARLLLETPAAILLARRAYAVLHAGAVVGPAGAVVIRGAPGAGKSTLVAAAYRAGFAVLGDETVLAARSDPDDLLAAVRDLTVLPDTASLLGLAGDVTPVDTGREVKHRIDLFRGSTPAARRARRAATVLLGSREDGPARLEALEPEEFLRRFHEGDIVQERWSRTPPDIAASWARRGRGSYRLSGAADLAGAVRLLARLVTLPAAASDA